MLFATLLDKISQKLNESARLRLLYYALVLGALIAVAACVKNDGVAFVYNEF